MSSNNLSTGKLGEDAAVNYLRKRGYQIVQRNFRIRNGEIDVIAIDQSTKPETLVFVEVKTREGKKFGTPLEAITRYKLKYLIRAATFYSMSHPKLPRILRIDAVSVVIGSGKKISEIEHCKNISG
jgi:putative endonuclease